MKGKLQPRMRGGEGRGGEGKGGEGKGEEGRGREERGQGHSVYYASGMCCPPERGGVWGTYLGL